MPRLNIVMQTKGTSSYHFAYLINLNQSSKPLAASKTDAPLNTCSNTFFETIFSYFNSLMCYYVHTDTKHLKFNNSNNNNGKK